MVTYQDFLRVPDTDEDRMKFVYACIGDHKDSDAYKIAQVAEDYDAHKNRTICEYQKLLYDVSGNTVPDNWSANFKMSRNFFDEIVTQENQYLLGNGVTWGKEDTKKKLGGDDFDTQVQDLGEKALIEGTAFGFWNYDHMDVFALTEFAPLYDEENGALMAGIRFWQIDDNKPLRATLYEVDGYTDIIYNRRNEKTGDREGDILSPKRPYKITVGKSVADGEIICNGENYPTFPIVPLWGNKHKQSEIVGMREQIDCYDLIKSGYANNVDEGSLIYWTLQNAGGMDDVDLAQFVEKMKTLHAATTDNMVNAEPHTFEAPYASREALLATLRTDIYDDAMALDIKAIADGAVTATQIKAAYEKLNSKTDKYEYCVRKFLKNLLEVAGIDDVPTFTRSQIVNNQEELQLLLQAAQFLDQEYVTRKILELFGDGDKADEILKRIAENEIRMAQEMAEMQE
jgi:SPP1 family phage portal protein